MQRAIAKMGRKLIPGRAGVTTDGVLNNQYRARCMGRGRCGRGCDLNAAFHSPAALIFPARDSGNLTVRTDSVVSEILIDDSTNKATGVRVIDKNTKETMDFKGRLVIVAASCLESTRLLLNSRSANRPERRGQLVGRRRALLLRARDGPGRERHRCRRARAPSPTNDDGRPQSTYIVRFRNVTDKHPDFIRGYGFQGASGAAEYPANAADDARLRRRVQADGARELPGAWSTTAASARCWRARRTACSSTPRSRTRGACPALKFDYTFGDNEKKMAADMADTAEEMLRAAGATDITVRRNILTEGWSIHEMGTARMGDDPKTSVTNSFGQTHDVKNLFVVDGSIFVSASCQNPTWMIMALCWRAMDYVKDEMKRGNL